MIQRAPEPGPRKGLRRPLRIPSAEVWTLFAAALVLRVVYVVLVHKLEAVPSSDSIAYDDLGWNIARGMGFQFTGPNGLYPTAKAPLLPWLVSLVYRMTGHVYF